MIKLAIATAALALLCGACRSKSQHDGAAAATAKIKAVRDRICACADAGCARAANDELVKLTKEQSATFSQSELAVVTQLGQEAGDCLARLTLGKSDAGSGSAVATAPGSGSAPPPAGSDAAAPTGLPKECDDYKAVVDHIQTCEALPKQARETLLKAFADAAEGWRKHEGPDKVKDGVACKDAAAALAATGKARCAW